jgi:hypothetical protein
MGRSDGSGATLAQRLAQKPAGPGPYAIVCKRFEGSNQQKEADQHIVALTLQELPEAISVREGDATVVYYGHYERVDDPKLRKALERILRLRYRRGDPSFPDARVAPKPKVTLARRIRQKPSVPGPYTILCKRFEGPYQDADARRHVAAMEAKRMPAAFTVREGGGTLLYYGQYKTAEDAQLDKDMSLIVQFRYGTGELSFPGARLVPVPKPAEQYYPLAQAEGYYSLQVAVFFGPQAEGRTRQQSAVMLAKALRERRHEAYVHHGPTVSAVCLGTFAEDAIEMPYRPPMRGQRGTRKNPFDAEEFARMTRVVDPDARALQRQFPEMAHNGKRRVVVIKRRGGGERRVNMPSLFVKIPEPASAEELIAP